MCPTTPIELLEQATKHRNAMTLSGGKLWCLLQNMWLTLWQFLWHVLPLSASVCSGVPDSALVSTDVDFFIFPWSIIRIIKELTIPSIQIIAMCNAVRQSLFFAMSLAPRFRSYFTTHRVDGRSVTVCTGVLTIN